MMASRPNTDNVVSEDKQVFGLQVTSQGNDEIKAIRIRHFSKDKRIISECMLLPEDAYNYAQAIMEAYDDIEDIE